MLEKRAFFPVFLQKKAEIEKKSLNSAATSKFSLFSQQQKWMSGKKMDEIYFCNYSKDAPPFQFLL